MMPAMGDPGMDPAQEREELDALVRSPGWAWLVAEAQRRWSGHGYVAALKHALADAKARQADLSEVLERLDAAQDAVNAILSWPTDRIATLSRHEDRRREPVALSRGGV